MFKLKNFFQVSTQPDFFLYSKRIETMSPARLLADNLFLVFLQWLVFHLY